MVYPPFAPVVASKRAPLDESIAVTFRFGTGPFASVDTRPASVPPTAMSVPVPITGPGWQAAVTIAAAALAAITRRSLRSLMTARVAPAGAVSARVGRPRASGQPRAGSI